MKMPLPVRQHWQGLHSRDRTTIHNYFTRLSGERKEGNMGKHEIFVNLMNLIGSIDGAVTFMPMVSSITNIK